LLNSRTIPTAALTLAFLSGAAALAHQVLWVRMMVDVLGAGAGTFARVTGAFFLGLALGAWIAAIRSPRNPWLGLGVVEALVGLFAGIVLAACTQIPQFFPSGLPAYSEWVLPFLLIIPPAFGMGMTLPWMIRASRASGKRSTWLYAINTMGAVLGIILILAWALPHWGLRGAALGAVGVNLLIALAAGILAFRDSHDREANPLPLSNAPSARCVIAFVSGFLVLSQETLLQQQFAQVTINSLFSSGTVLAFVLLCLAAAAFLVPALVRKIPKVDHLLAISLALAAATCALQPLIFTLATSGMQALNYEVSGGAYILQVCRLGLMTIAPVMLCAGLIFPLLILDSQGNARAVGQLIAWNGLGGLLGAELTQIGLGPEFGLWQGMAVLACGYLLLLARTGSRVLLGSAALFVVVGILWSPRLPQAGINSPARIAAIKMGPEGMVGVIERGEDDWNILFNNTYTLGGSRAQYNQERQALLPLILHGEAKTAATLGVATGSTLAGAALDGRLERIDAMELSPLAARYAREYFAPYNRNVFADPRVNVLIGDARWLISAKPDTYDVVIGDLFLPWRTGEGRLFSREHFLKVKASLREGGIFCQWLPLYQLTQAQYELILRTFLSVFPEAFLVRGDFYYDRPIIGLIGGRRLEDLDWQKIAQATERLKKEGQTKDALVRNTEGVAMLLLGTPPPPPPGPENTLANAELEWDAGRNIIGLPTPWFAKRDFMEYCETTKSQLAEVVPGEWHSALNASSRLLHHRKGDPGKLLPSSLAVDWDADWQKWPGMPKPFQK